MPVHMGYRSAGCAPAVPGGASPSSSGKWLLVVQGRPLHTVRSFDDRRIGAITDTARDDGNSAVFFADEVETFYGRYGAYAAVTRIGFLGVPNVRVVKRFVMEVMDVIHVLPDGLEDGDLMAMLPMRGRKAGGNDLLVIDPCDDLLRKVYLD